MYVSVKHGCVFVCVVVVGVFRGGRTSRARVLGWFGDVPAKTTGEKGNHGGRKKWVLCVRMLRVACVSVSLWGSVVVSLGGGLSVSLSVCVSVCLSVCV